MSSLRTTSSVGDNLGNLHIVTGVITANASNVWQVASSNDDTVTVADTGTGNATVTFGQAFTSAPVVVANVVKATHSAQIVQTVTIEAVTTTTAEFRYHSVDDTGAGTTDVTSPDPAENDGFHFVAIGLRDN